MTGFFIFLALWAFKPGSFVPFSILNAWKKVCKVHEHCTQQQNQPASDGYAFFKCTPRDSRARTIGWQIWTKHAHKGIIRRSLQRFISASIIIINKRVSEGCIFKYTIDSRPTDTLLLRTPYHCRQEAFPGETNKEMTEIYSRYYRLSLLRTRKLPPPPWVCSITRVYCKRQFGSLRDDGTTGPTWSSNMTKEIPSETLH